MKKIALIIGHSRFRQGARNKKSGLSEYQYNKQFVKRLYYRIVHAVFFPDSITKIFYRKIGMKTLHARINKYSPDIAIEFHCNAVKDKNISGGEILVGEDSFVFELQGDMYDLSSRISGVLNNRNRGLKVVRKTGRGGKFLHNVKAELKFIAEPFFISNDSDLEKALNKQDELIEIFVEFIKNSVEW